MPAAVDDAIQSLMAKGYSKSRAIAILKSQGTIKQEGRHLAAGESLKRRVKKRVRDRRASKT